MFSIHSYREPINPTSSLPAHPKTPAHLRQWTNISRTRADEIMMALSCSQKPAVSQADMRCVRDMTGDRALFVIELQERSGGQTTINKYPVSQFVYASAYCLYLEGQQEPYLALSEFCSQLTNNRPTNPARALAALNSVTATLPSFEPPAAGHSPMDLLLRHLPPDNPATGMDTTNFQQPAAPLPTIAEEVPEPRPTARANRRQRRVGLQRH